MEDGNFGIYNTLGSNKKNELNILCEKFCLLPQGKAPVRMRASLKFGKGYVALDDCADSNFQK